mgnify:CR=1 FL=1
MHDSAIAYMIETALRDEVTETTFEAFCELRDTMKSDTEHHDYICSMLFEADGVDGKFYLPDCFNLKYGGDHNCSFTAGGEAEYTPPLDWTNDEN